MLVQKKYRTVFNIVQAVTAVIFAVWFCIEILFKHGSIVQNSLASNNEVVRHYGIYLIGLMILSFIIAFVVSYLL